MYDFIDTKDLGVTNFQLCTNLPKTVYSNRTTTLKDAGLTPKALVIVENITS